MIGRGAETDRIEAALGRLPDSGAVFIIRGEAGIGKTSLLEFGATGATKRGYRPLRTSGVEAESHLPFAGLHQIVRPVLSLAERLPGIQRDALLTAIGRVAGGAPAIHLVALAVLNLIAELATEAPVVVTVDDAHWLDAPTAEVLAFVARRIEADPILFVIAIRTGFDSPLLAARLPDIALDPLNGVSSAQLLDRHAPGLARRTRERVLDLASGNPLALVELPIGVADPEARRRTQDVLPLTIRLQQAFAARASALPTETRQAVLVAALDEASDLADILAATSRLAGHEAGTVVLDPAVAAGLISIASTAVTFRHPLVRSAIDQSSLPGERRTAHRALAASVDDPDRSAWHRAASVVGFDDDAAGELEQAARRARDRGATSTALVGMERAAVLTGDPRLRASRLLATAGLAYELGQPEVVARMVGDAEKLGLDGVDALRATWLGQAFQGTGAADGALIERLVTAADEATFAGERELSRSLLNAAAYRCWWTDYGDEARASVLGGLDRLAATGRDPLLIEVRGLAAPVDSFDAVATGIEAELDTVDDAAAVQSMAFAAHTVGHFERSQELLSRSIPVLRDEGRLGLLAQALTVRAWDEIHLGRFDASDRDADEGRRLAAETGQPVWQTGASIAVALLAGIRGDHVASGRLSAAAESVALPARLSNLLSVNQLARGLADLTAGQYGGAFDDLRLMFDSGDVAFNQVELYAAVGYVAEAAVHADRVAEARNLMPDLEALGQRTAAPLLHVGLRFARAILAGDAVAERRWAEALSANPGGPFDAARLRLAHGRWLRRQRRIAESRPHLRAARDAFAALRLGPWADRAQQELRASGERSPDRLVTSTLPLSPQELQIAQMAADGLSNREIGERLFLSHRTVGSHLYRVFPKLGIASRAELRDALDQGERLPA